MANCVKLCYHALTIPSSLIFSNLIIEDILKVDEKELLTAVCSVYFSSCCYEVLGDAWEVLRCVVNVRDLVCVRGVVFVHVKVLWALIASRELFRSRVMKNEEHPGRLRPG